LAGAGNFSLHHCVKTGSEAHPTSYLMENRGSLPGDKAAGHEADHSPPSSAVVKNVWRYTSAPPVRLHGGCLVEEARGHLYFYLQLHIIINSVLSFERNLKY
jgi:hypothetical protein